MATLYTTHCPKCKVLSKKLNDANVSYVVCDDVDVMTSKGIMSAPMLEVDGNMFDFGSAISWISSL